MLKSIWTHLAVLMLNIRCFLINLCSLNQFCFRDNGHRGRRYLLNNTDKIITEVMVLNAVASAEDATKGFLLYF